MDNTKDNEIMISLENLKKVYKDDNSSEMRFVKDFIEYFFNVLKVDCIDEEVMFSGKKEDHQLFFKLLIERYNYYRDNYDPVDWILD